VAAHRKSGLRGRDIVSPRLATVIGSLESGEFCQDDPVRYAPIVASLSPSV